MAQKSLEQIFGVGSKDPRREEFDFSIGKTISNIPSSAKGLVKDLFTAVKSPVQTFKAIGQVGAGAVQSIPGLKGAFSERAEQVGKTELLEENRAVFSSFVDLFQERYGSAENLQRTVQNDPVGFAFDVSSLLTLGGGGLKQLSKAGKFSKLGKVGGLVGKAGRAIDPINASLKAVQKTGKGLGFLSTRGLGITTGKGTFSIERAFTNPTPEFRNALRGNVDSKNLFTVARDGLQNIRDTRARNYRNQLKTIEAGNKPIDTTGFNNFIKTKLDEFNIKIDKKGELDFSSSTIADTTEQGRIQSVIDGALKWEDTTALGLDTLKQRLDDFYTPSGKGRSLTNSVRAELNNTLKKEVPGYTKLVGDYEQSTKLIKDIEKALSLGDKSSVDSALTKLISTVKGNKEFRLELVKTLDDITKTDIQGLIAGTELSKFIPAGLIGRAAAVTAGAQFFNVGLLSPKLLFGLAATSPRIVGELFLALGLGAKQIERITNSLKKIQGAGIITAQGTRVTAGQTGRVIDRLQEQQQKSKKPLEDIFK